MARTRRVGKRNYPPKRVAYKMSNKTFYERQPRKFPYGEFPYVQPTYWIAGYCENET
tara:strand:+ start:35010 stop:35180 length:171 start_codon:yes stop_codon:yes gene_type:complete